MQNLPHVGVVAIEGGLFLPSEQCMEVGVENALLFGREGYGAFFVMLKQKVNQAFSIGENVKKSVYVSISPAQKVSPFELGFVYIASKARVFAHACLEVVFESGGRIECGVCHGLSVTE